ncbi:Transcriptional regulatory protein OmpR [Hartmannibacter diazotrophicus]|uniref:Transcriptional regulatory protein OmpR n=1 Tax=Hartmannibacter diazotrophicus TaxID=1482074 RepID=A0A2C9D9Z8_9HYPH|nr:response regulator transcription factor [Hartmannibacter diazotrophicus]SON57053.1 Transcriptional regulatory protein OmpR [Hartmannibacter diazotrophicus]
MTMTDVMPSGAPADDAQHILVVDDDSRIRSLLQRFLAAQGYRVTTAGNAAEARRKLELIAFDLIVLDVMMPGEDGLSLAASLNRTHDVAILLLTARAEGEDRVRGLETGVDDYMTKPFEPRELVLRIQNILKRRSPTARPDVRGDTTATRRVTFGRFAFDVAREDLLENGEPVRLTERERQLLTLFAKAPDGIVARELLVGNDASVGERTVDVQINRLRRKIEDDPSNPTYLQTVRGVGYRLRFD